MKTRNVIRLLVVLGVLLSLFACPRRVVAQTAPRAASPSGFTEVNVSC
jgi:hypothetical protein